MLASTIEIRHKMAALVRMLVEPYSDASLDKMIPLFEEIKSGVARTTDAYRAGYFYLDIANFLAKELRVNPGNEKAKNYLKQIIQENLEQVKCEGNPLIKIKKEFFEEQESVFRKLIKMGQGLFTCIHSNQSGESQPLVGNSGNLNYKTIN